MTAPNTVLGIAALITAAASAHAQPLQFTERTLLIGDSITLQLSAHREWSSTAILLGGSGQRMADFGPSLVPGVAAFLAGQGRAKIARVVILLGTNDVTAAVAPGVFRRAYAQSVRGAAPVATVWCMLPLPRRDDDADAEPYRQIIRDECDHWIDPREVIPEWSATLYRDALHLSPAGSAVLGDWLVLRTAQ